MSIWNRDKSWRFLTDSNERFQASHSSNNAQVFGQIDINIHRFCLLRFSSRKYAEAKRCAKNATLSLCKNTPHLVDQVNFIYDRFNPFCFNLADPPLAKKSRESVDRVPRESRQRDVEQGEAATESFSVSTSGGTQSVKPLRFVAVASLLVARVLF